MNKENLNLKRILYIYFVVSLIAIIMDFLLVKNIITTLGILLLTIIIFLLVTVPFISSHKRKSFIISFLALGLLILHSCCYLSKTIYLCYINKYSGDVPYSHYVIWCLYVCIISSILLLAGITKYKKTDFFVEPRAKSQKTAKTPSANVSSPVISMADDLCDALIAKGLSHYLLSDYKPTTHLTYSDWDSREKTRRKLNLILFDIIKYLNLPPVIKLDIVYVKDRMPNNQQQKAGEYKSSSLEKGIVLNIFSDFEPQNAISVLCHECTHCFMEKNMLNLNNGTDEQRTDILANLLGFSKLMSAGYKTIVTTQMSGSIQTTRTQTIGYITSEECLAISRHLKTVRAQLASKEKQDELRKSKISDLLLLIDTAKILSDNLSLMDPQKTMTEAELSQDSYLIFMNSLCEYESHNLSKEIDDIAHILKENPNIHQIEVALSSIQNLCENMSRWIAVFQGKV